MLKVSFEPVILNKIILFSIVCGAVFCKGAVTSLQTKSSSSNQYNAKSLTTNQSCQESECEITCSEIGWSWFSMITVYSEVYKRLLDALENIY